MVNPCPVLGLRIGFTFALYAGVVFPASAQLFSDDFSRSTDPGPIAPWIEHSGNWVVSGGAMASTQPVPYSYSTCYITNSWTNYMVQASIRFSSFDVYGGGIGGRLNPCCGMRYGVWVYPNFPTAGVNTLELLKFQGWETWGYGGAVGKTMQSVPIPFVGTNWHTIQIAFQENSINVAYDGSVVISALDVESDPNWSGGISLDSWENANAFTMYFDNVTVTPLPPVITAADNAYLTTEGTGLTISGPGVLAGCISARNTNLVAIPVTAPSQGTLTLNPNGSFNYVPAPNFAGVDTFTYAACDGISTSAPAVISIDVSPSTNLFYDNFSRTPDETTIAPWIVGLGNWYITNGVMLGSSLIVNDYSDCYVPIQVTDFSIEATIQLPANGWACGVSGRLDPVTGSRYVANVYPENSPLGPGSSLRLIKFHSWMTWNSNWVAMALVPLPGVGTTNHNVKMAFYGNQIDVYYDGNRVVHATDNNVDYIPFYRSGDFGIHMYMDDYYQAVFESVKVTALPPVNTAPMLPAQSTFTVPPLSRLVVTNTATDLDIPANPLSYTLLSAPPSASIDTNGIISWTPGPGDASTTNLFTTVVTDFNPGATNSQHLSATNSFQVLVGAAAGPVIQSINITPNGATLIWSSSAGHTYRVQFKDQLNQAAWSDLAPDVQASGPLSSVTNAVGSSLTRFYRVMLVQ